MKKRFKVLFTFVALLLVTLTLVACTTQAEKDIKSVEEAKESLVIGFTSPDTASSVTQNVTLKATEGEVAITWVSNNAAVITSAGVVTRPEADTVVELTATLKKGEATDTKKFDLTVKAADVVIDPDIAIVAGVKDALALGFATGDTAASVTADLTLKTSEEGVAITWASNNTAVITNAGVVTRPAADAAVKLTATLTKGAVKETKVFDVTVLAAEVVETGARAALIAHYETTFGNYEWLATEDVVLVDTITGSDENEYNVTWEIVVGADFFALDGTVTRPTFTQGDQTVQLKATIEDGSTNNFFFAIEKLEQTNEEKVLAALDQVTVIPSSTTGYQEINFSAETTIKIDDKEVAVTWETSNTNAMTKSGELVPFDDEDEKVVELTAKITYEGTTLEKTISFKVKKSTIFADFNAALTVENFKSEERVAILEVSYYASISGGYYLASNGNRLAFVYGNKPNNVKEGKLYSVMFNVDIYYGTFQIKDVALVNERDGDLPVITPVEMTLQQIVDLPKPSEQNPNHHTLYNLINVEVRVDSKTDNYKTFFVPKGQDRKVTLTDKNSIMVYYLSNMGVIQNIDGLQINSVQVINNGYRTNNIVWNVNFVGELADIDLNLTDKQKVDTVKSTWDSAINNLIYKATNLGFPTSDLGTSIVWTSSHPEVISNTGVVVIPTEATEVTLNATITLNDEEVLLERVVLVGSGPEITSDIEDVIAGKLGNLFQVTGVITGITGNRGYSIEDESGSMAIYVNNANVILEIGFEYTIIGNKAVHNGLIQLTQVEPVTKGDKKVLPTAVDVTEAMLAHEDGITHLQGKLINIEKALVKEAKSDDYGNIELVLAVGLEEFSLKWDSRMELTAAAQDHLKSIKANDVVKLIAVPLGWSNGPLLGYNVETQIEVLELTNAEKIELDKFYLELEESYLQDFTLPIKGGQGSDITWAVTPEASLVEGKLVIPAEHGEVDLALVATIKLGELTETKNFNVTMIRDNGMSVSEARSEAAGEKITVQGIVTGVILYDNDANTKYMFISDADGTTIALYYGFNDAFTKPAKVGDLIKVIGTRATHGGLEQITGATFELLKENQALPAAVVLTEFPTFTADDQGKRFSIEGLMVVSASGRNLKVTDGTKEMVVYVDVNRKDLTDHIATAEGKKVNLVNIHLGWYNGSQFLIYNAAEVVVVELTQQEKLDADKAALELSESYTTEFTLPVLGGNASAITWVADPAASLVDGKLVIPAEGEDVVTLTATLTLGTLSDTKVFTVTLKELGEVEEELLYSIDFEGGTQNGYLRNVDTTLGVEGGLNWHIATETTKDSGVLWNYSATQDTNITAEQGQNIARLHGKNETTITSDAISNVTKLVFDAKFYGTITDSNLKVQIKVGDGEFVDAFTVNLASTFNTFTVNINEENVQIRFVATGERSNLDNIRIYG